MKSKVLIIVENLPVPFDTRVWKEAISLRKAEYEVTVLCPRGRIPNKAMKLLEGVHIYRHPMPEEGNSAARICLGIRVCLILGVLVLLVDLLAPRISCHSGLQSSR